MSSIRNLYRVAGALERRRHQATIGSCTLHPGRPSVGFIDDTTGVHPKGRLRLREQAGYFDPG